MAQRRLLNQLGFHGKRAEVNQRKIHAKSSALELKRQGSLPGPAR